MRLLNVRTTLFASLASIIWAPLVLQPSNVSVPTDGSLVLHDASPHELFTNPSESTHRSQANNPPSNPGEPELDQVIRQTYLWSWPMVHLHNMRKPLRLLSRFGVSGGVPVAPVNQVCMLTDLISPEMRSIPCPNRDVLYGFGMLDLTDSPVVIQVPDFGARLWVYQLGDQRTESFAELGSMYRSEPGFYLAVGPNWAGTHPHGIKKVFRSTTNLAYLIPRVSVDGSAESLAQAQAILPQVVVYPLDRFNGKLKTQDWGKKKWYPNIGSSSREQSKWVKPETFFHDLESVLDEITPLEHEQLLYEQAKWLVDQSHRNPEVRSRLDTLQPELEKTLVAPLFHFRNFGKQVSHFWTTVDNGARFGADFFTRTAVARSNIFVNRAVEAKYFHTDQSATGELLHGDREYHIRIAPSEVPANHGFWSLTLYDENHHFYSNPWQRYAIQSGDRLHYETDGSIHIVISEKPPENGQHLNWLPAPKANYSLYLRVYAPDETVINGDWTPPAVVNASDQSSHVASR